MNSGGCNGNLTEGASLEILGDAQAGYIVNVVREIGEEAVRIPASISAKLKAHQVLHFFGLLLFLLLLSVIGYKNSFSCLVFSSCCFSFLFRSSRPKLFMFICL